MRVMVFVKATEDSENGVIGPPEAFEAMGRFKEELVNAGSCWPPMALHPPPRASASPSTAPAAPPAGALGGLGT